MLFLYPFQETTYESIQSLFQLFLLRKKDKGESMSDPR